MPEAQILSCLPCGWQAQAYAPPRPWPACQKCALRPGKQSFRFCWEFPWTISRPITCVPVRVIHRGNQLIAYLRQQTWDASVFRSGAFGCWDLYTRAWIVWIRCGLWRVTQPPLSLCLQLLAHRLSGGGARTSLKHDAFVLQGSFMLACVDMHALDRAFVCAWNVAAMQTKQFRTICVRRSICAYTGLVGRWNIQEFNQVVLNICAVCLKKSVFALTPPQKGRQVPCYQCAHARDVCFTETIVAAELAVAPHTQRHDEGDSNAWYWFG